MDFHSDFSDDSSNNTNTTCEHMKNLIHWMYEEIFLMQNGIIFDTTDGRRKKYIYADSL